MKKDIAIPVVKNVELAIVYEYNAIYKTNDWYAYLINKKEVALETVLIVSKGYDKEKGIETSTMRHKLEILPANSVAKVELLQEDVLQLTNSFLVTFFEDGKLLDKTFTFTKGTITKANLQELSFGNKKGILSK